MKTFWKALAGLAILFVITGCPNGGGGGTTIVPINSITLTYLEAELSTTAGVTLNVDEVTAAIQAVCDPPNVKFVWIPEDPGFVTVSNGVLTGIAAGSTQIRCQASNSRGGVIESKFPVTVRPKLTSFDVIYGSEAVSYTNDNEWRTGDDINLHITMNPTGAENKFEWTSSPAGLSITDYTSGSQTGKTLKAASDGTFAITITPTQAGLSASEVTARTKVFTAVFSQLASNPVTSLSIRFGDESGDEINYTDGVPLKRGRTIDLYADPDVTAGTTITWSFTSSIVTKEESGRTATFSAADGDIGDTVSITVSAGNTDNGGSPIIKQFTINVPARGNTVFEWYADENPDEEDLADGAVRNYAGFRDVFISATAATTATPTNGRVLAFNGSDFYGMKVGNTPENYGTTSAQSTRLSIGIAPNATQTQTILNGGITGSGNTNVGTIDLSKPVKLTLEFSDYAFTGNMRIYVNNNSTTYANSNLGYCSQIKHYANGTTFMEDDGFTTISGKKGTYQCIIDFSNTSMYNASEPIEAFETFTSAQRNELKKAFICVAPGNTAGNWINITGIKIEIVAQTDIIINPDAKFGDFPDEPFTLTGSEQKVITLNDSGYTGADWYINGVLKASDSMTYTADAGVLDAGSYSLTAVVTVDGQLYSKKVAFTVE